jgi:hypothetical protein
VNIYEEGAACKNQEQKLRKYKKQLEEENKMLKAKLEILEKNKLQ